MRVLLLVLLTVHSQEPVAETRIADTTCRNSSFMEGDTADIHFFIRQDIDFANDPHLVMFIKKDNLPGNLIQCDRKNQSTTLVCGAPNGRLISQGFLMGNELSIITPNASSSQQGFYELHVVANGAFDPPIGCYLFVEDKAGAQPGEGESGNTMAVVIPAVIVLAMLLLIVPGIVFILRRRKHVKRVHSKTINEKAHRGTSVSLSAPESPDSGYSTPVDKTDSSERGSVMLKTSVRSNDNDGQLTDDQTAPVPETENSRDDQNGAQPTETDGLLQNETDPPRTNSENSPQEIPERIEEATECGEDGIAFIDNNESNVLKGNPATPVVLPVHDTGQSVIPASSFASSLGETPAYSIVFSNRQKQPARPTDDHHKNKSIVCETSV